MTKGPDKGILSDEVILYDEFGDIYNDANPVPTSVKDSALPAGGSTSALQTAAIAAIVALGVILGNILTTQTDSTQLTQITDGSTPVAVVQNVDVDTNLDDEYGLVTDSILYGRISDTIVKPYAMDASTHAFITTSYEHHEIHSGSHFYACDYQSFTNAQVVDFTVVTPNTTEWSHMTFSIDGTGALSVEIREGAVVDVAGAAIVAHNNNRNSGNTTSLTLRSGDTYTGEGTLIFSQYSGANKVAGNVDREKEIILDQNNTYIFRLTNETALANIINWCAEWYEHTDKD